jgi:hypothetical protein
MFPTEINARIYLSGISECSNPQCDRMVVDYGSALILCTARATVAFCGLRCLALTIAQHLEREQANPQASGGNDLLTRLSRSAE